MICKGIITDLVGQPIPKAIITIKSIRGATAITSSVYFHQCNDKGEYNFSLLKGKYKIWVQNSNFSDKNLVGVGIVESDTPDGDIDSILVAEDTPTPDEPITPSGCECSWIKKTFIPIYFYISRDSSVADVSEEYIQDFFNNLVASYNYNDSRERFSPLVKLNVDGDVYALPIPNVTGSNELALYAYSFIGVVDDDSYFKRETPPFYNETFLSIYHTGVIHGNKISLTLYKDSNRGYLYLSHDNTETDPTPMTFKFLETIKPYAAEEEPEVPPENNPDIPPEEDKPEDTPETPTPEIPEDYITPVGVVEGVLSPYTLKVRFKDTWYHDPGRFSAYHINMRTWRPATKIVDDVVYFIFTEEDVYYCNDKHWDGWVFSKHPPMPIEKMLRGNAKYESAGLNFRFNDTISDDVVNIEDIPDTNPRVNIGSAYI